MFLDALEVFMLHLGVDILSHHSFAAFIVEYKYTNPLEELPILYPLRQFQQSISCQMVGRNGTSTFLSKNLTN
mgnify:CR=1 FL=1